MWPLLQIQANDPQVKGFNQRRRDKPNKFGIVQLQTKYFSSTKFTKYLLYTGIMLNFENKLFLSCLMLEPLLNVCLCALDSLPVKWDDNNRTYLTG